MQSCKPVKLHQSVTSSRTPSYFRFHFTSHPPNQRNAQELVNHEKIFQELDSLPWSKAVNLDIEIGGANIPSF